MMAKCPLCKNYSSKKEVCDTCSYPIKGTDEEKHSFKQKKGKDIIRMAQKVKYKADENMIAMFAMAVLSLLATIYSFSQIEWGGGIFMTLVYIGAAFFTYRNPILIPVVAVIFNIGVWLLVYMPHLIVGPFALIKIGCFIYCVVNGLRIRKMRKEITINFG